ncbi:MAG: phosphosulfolactate synthase, partial [Flavobacteriales bacterium]|nr:phosphosulfolactate synthase [Flavobacteriales bacterium]
MNFKLTHIPERPEKPREKGLTMVMDKGLSLRQAEDLIETCADKIDLLKLGFGTSYVTNNLAEKIKLFQDANIRVYPGGTLFEAFIARKKFDDFRRFLDKFNLDMCEVSDGSIVLDHDEKCEYIQKLKSPDRTVLSEVGSKEEGILISPGKWIKMMQKELEAGSWKVIAEGRESGSVGIFRPNGKPHTILINKIIAKIPPDKILWEAPGKKQQVWFIDIFGPNVSLGNIAPHDVIPLE